MMSDKHVCIFSYNSRGFNTCKREFIRNFSLMAGCKTFIFNQENFLLKNNGYMARNALPDHYLFIKPAVKDGLEGRPKNGMFIAVPASLKEFAKKVTVNSDRLQCIITEMSSSKLLLINSYFPTDPRVDFDENDLLTLLADIRKIVDENDFDHVILGGDINADFGRKTKFVSIIKEFISDLDLRKSWDIFKGDFSHTTEKDGVTFTSLIDHFFWNKRITDLVEDAGVIYSAENMSDHCPIFCKLNIQPLASETLDVPPDPVNFPLSWRASTDEEKVDFVRVLGEKLGDVRCPYHALTCRNVHCKAANHVSDLDDLMSDLIEAIEISANETLKKKGGTSTSAKRSLPNWKEDVDPVKDTAQFWNAVWKSAGKPINCHLHSIMKRTRNKYHLVIRKKKRLLERMKRENMLESCINNDMDIFKEIRKQRSCKQALPSTIDGRSKDIPEYLAGKYEQLYNQVDDKSELLGLEHDLSERFSEDSLQFVDRISATAIAKAVRDKLKPGKTDPVSGITSDYLIHAPAELFEILSKCFQSFIIHAHVSGFLLISSMVPLLKDKLGDITSSNNYRSIAISSLIMKIFDLVIISEFSEYLNLDDLQFSYQSEVSTSMCTWVAVESISYFLRNDSEVYTCLMDMSKAFDTVQHSHLFKKLLEQGMPAIVVRFILISYKNQKANVKWNGKESRYFSIGNGVKQGAILSAILYCIYTNGLFQE